MADCAGCDPRARRPGCGCIEVAAKERAVIEAAKALVEWVAKETHCIDLGMNADRAFSELEAAIDALGEDPPCNTARAIKAPCEGGA